MIEILESGGLMDVMIPFFILPIILFFLTFALLNSTKIKIKVIMSVIIGILGTLLFIIGHVMGLFPSWLDIVEMINMFLPQIIVYTIPYFIALFPLLILMKNKRFFNIFLLVFFVIMAILNSSNLILLILPLSVISLVYNKREQIIKSESIKTLSIIFSSIGLGLILLLFLIRNTNFYQFMNNWFGMNLFYLILISWIVLWSIQTLVLYKKYSFPTTK